ncbi:site-specific tyrosine recombinase XerD [Pedobacter faecalis]|uniref:site-specific tyrosine recombinase XerD n=1 Tax=Pedobacter faecalis TaxID=3041495 RepID=UPI00254E1F7C|nr:site-specific tyrosine recombinase XerD [Pedobacter sp. ELA7]
MQIEACLRPYKNYLRLERGLSANSIEAYLSDVRKLDQYLQSVSKTTDIKLIDIYHLKEFITWISELGMLASSQARVISSIKSFFSFLVLEQLIIEDPSEVLDAPRIPRKLPDVLNVEEINALIAAVDASKPDGMRNKAMLEILYGCGLRVSELVNLKLSQIFIEEGFIKVLGKGNKERLVPIGSTALKMLMIYLEEVRVQVKIIPGYADYAFLSRRGSGLTRVFVFKVIKSLAEKIGLNKAISPHTFRHSFATHLIEGGADLRAIQEMLGHSSITTTEIYMHLDRDYLRSVVMQYHPRS